MVKKVIKLSYSDAMLAAMAGCMRTVENIKIGRRPAHRADQGELGDYEISILGCMGEMAVAKALNVPWHGKGEFRGPDVGADSQVRATMHPRGCLVLHDDDPDDKEFFLARMKRGTLLFEVFTTPVLGKVGKDKRWWRTDVRSPAYFVPLDDRSGW